MAGKNKYWMGGKRWLWIIAAALLFFGLWQLLTNIYSEEEKDIRRQIRQTIKENFPEQARKYSQTTGLFFYREGENTTDEIDEDRQAVILVHGLDDPGKVWQDLAPELARNDFAIWLLYYPNDQPIVESTQLFLKELKQLKHLGIHNISIVAHSMGGLVSRELLTCPEIDYSRLTTLGKVPKVDKFIMVGTPNHGSQIARFRFFGEVRDQLDRLAKGEANLLGFVLDGAGEAKIDLLPGSSFLNELNSRPHPEKLDTLIIAGITAPWSESEITRWLEDINQDEPGGPGTEMKTLAGFMISMSNGLGDGLVTLESTRLQGIPHRTVKGTHLSMIRNITENGKRIPPAIPMIVNTLRAEK
jgi:pimeloyl-ACP methyl ester carboxylesterase